MPSSRLRIAEADSVKRARSVRLDASREASMLAIGASSRGAGSRVRRGRAVWKVWTQVTSGDSRSTWRRFQTMPISSTSRIRLLRIGLLP